MAKVKKETEENEALEFCQKYIEYSANPRNQKRYSKLFDLTRKYNYCAKTNQQYHLNILDEVRKDPNLGRKLLSENTHSRILCKLLQYKDEEGYAFLKSLLEYISVKNESFIAIKVDNPTITQEEKRIDLWVRDKNYAIIFENKIYDAKDQDAQIARYIGATKDDECHKYEDKNIFVVYLSDYYKEPDDRTWGEGEKGKSLKKDFSSRYINLSFKYDILQWLEKCGVISKLEKQINDNKLFLSAIYQYKDHIKEKNTMNKELKNFIESKEGLDFKGAKIDAVIENISLYHKSIEKSIEYLESLRKGLDEYKREMIIKEINGWKENKLKKHIDKFKDDNKDLLVVKCKIGNYDYWLYIELNSKDENLENIFCTLEIIGDHKIPSNNNCIKEIKNILKDKDDEVEVTETYIRKRWPIKDYKKVSDVYIKIIKLVERKII